MFVLVLSFSHTCLGGIIMRTDKRSRYCRKYGFQTVSHERGKFLICRA